MLLPDPDVLQVAARDSFAASAGRLYHWTTHAHGLWSLSGEPSASAFVAERT